MIYNRYQQMIDLIFEIPDQLDGEKLFENSNQDYLFEKIDKFESLN